MAGPSTLCVNTPVPVNCSGLKGGKKRCTGILVRVDLSRLEEGLRHEGYQCDKCGRCVKYVPKE